MPHRQACCSALGVAPKVRRWSGHQRIRRGIRCTSHIHRGSFLSPQRSVSRIEDIGVPRDAFCRPREAQRVLFRRVIRIRPRPAIHRGRSNRYRSRSPPQQPHASRHNKQGIESPRSPSAGPLACRQGNPGHLDQPELESIRHHRQTPCPTDRVIPRLHQPHLAFVPTAHAGPRDRASHAWAKTSGRRARSRTNGTPGDSPEQNLRLIGLRCGQPSRSTVAQSKLR